MNTSTEIEKIDMGWVESCDGRSNSLVVASHEIMNVKSSENVYFLLTPPRTEHARAYHSEDSRGNGCTFPVVTSVT